MSAVERAVSGWFEDGMPPARPALAEDLECDVCVVGGGYTGLWTAHALLAADPSLSVVVLEREVCGFGASGRNGGWVVGELAGSREKWAAVHGAEAVRAQDRAIRATVDEVGRVVAEEGIECDFVKGGTMHVAQRPLELERLDALVAELRRWGGEEWTRLSAEETAARVGVVGVLGGAFSPSCARVQPARLVRGLAEAVERRGARVFEGTEVATIAPRLVRTSGGRSVRARWVVRATEGYSLGLQPHPRTIVPVASSMIVTEPLSDAAWSALRWDACETLLDGGRLYHYLQRTADGRIAIGGRGVPYLYGSKTGREGPLPARTAASLRAALVALFGAPLEGVGIDGAWHGVLGVPRDWQPTVGADPATGLAWAGGYTGEGVAAANLAGRTLRDLILGKETELSHLPWVHRGAAELPRWEPEPFRFLGIRSVYKLLGLADASEIRTGRSSRFAAAAAKLSGR